MAKDSRFYPDPAPLEPQPKLPPSAFTTGAQPPRIGSQTALLAALIASAWPQPNAPQLHQQNLSPRKVAPLTLAYGQQPSVQGPLLVEDLTTIRRQWPEDNEPRLPYRLIRPLTVTPPVSVIPTQEQPAFARSMTAIHQWWAIDPVTVITIADGAPLLPAQADDPPRVNPAKAPDLQARIAALFALDWPAQRGPEAIPPTATDAPPITSRKLEHIIRQWAAAERAITRRAVAAPWDVPIVVVSDPTPRGRFPNSILLAWRQDYALVRPVRIAPLLITVAAQSAYLIWGNATDLNAAIDASDLNAVIDAHECRG